MRKYEIMTITKISAGDDKAKETSKEVAALITANKGTVSKSDSWGKRKFAYEVDGLKEGYYDVLEFELPSTELSKVKTKLNMMDSVLRYLVTAKS